VNPHTVAMSDAWPSPDAQPGPLPRIEELPISDNGYEQEAVRAAFDAFYRHAAQLDASLRALEAVEVFRRDADALRNDLRAIRALGAGGFGAGEPDWARQTYERARPEVPAVVARLAAEAALIVAVAVIAGVAHLSSVVIVLLMAAAFLVVALSEWLAARARFVPAASGFVTSEPLEPAPYVEAPAPAWGADDVADDEADADADADEAEEQPGEADEQPGEPDEETEPEALTVVGAAAVDPWEQGGEPEPEPEASGQGFFRRRRR
jgi:hypothetical protein